jgi:hypothetical protein
LPQVNNDAGPDVQVPDANVVAAPAAPPAAWATSPKTRKTRCLMRLCDTPKNIDSLDDSGFVSQFCSHTQMFLVRFQDSLPCWVYFCWSLAKSTKIPKDVSLYRPF